MQQSWHCGGYSPNAAWSLKNSEYDAMSFVNIQEFMGCIPDDSGSSLYLPDSDVEAGNTLDNLATGDGSDYTPPPLTPEEAAELDDPTADDYYGNVTNPILPERCEANSRDSSNRMPGIYTYPNIAYDNENGTYILINDPPVLKLTGRYTRGDFNKEAVFHQEPGEVAPGITSNYQRLPEKGGLADAGYSQLDSPGQRSMFKGRVKGRVTIVVNTVNQTGGTVHFALLFTGLASLSALTFVRLPRYGARIGNASSELQFLSDTTARPEDTPWKVFPNENTEVFFTRNSANLDEVGSGTFSGVRSRAVNIHNNVRFTAHLELDIDEEVLLNVVYYRDFDAIPRNYADDLQYWGTYAYSRFSTGIYRGGMGIKSVGDPPLTDDTFIWEILDEYGEDWLPLVINGEEMYWWATHGLPKIPSTLIYRDYFYKQADGLSEVFQLTVKRANYTLPAYNSPTIPGIAAGSGSAWLYYPTPEIIIPCHPGRCAPSLVGRDPRTPDFEYANLANWGVVYTERLAFHNRGTRKRLFTYSLIDPNTFAANTGVRLVGVNINILVTGDSGLREELKGSRIITTKKFKNPTPVFTVCVPAHSTGNVRLEYALSSGSPFGLIHIILATFGETCESSVRPMSED